MRAWGGIAVVGALLVAAPGVSGASEPVAVTFTYSGGAESFTVPAHVHQVTIEACGAAGGSSESVAQRGDDPRRRRGLGPAGGARVPR